MCNSRRRRESSSRTWIDTVRGLHVLRRSMSSMILFSYSTSIAHFFLAKTGMTMLVSGRETRDGSADAGGVTLLMSAKRGETSLHHSWENILPGCFPYCICTFGTRVAGMLVRSSPLPLVIDYFKGNRVMTAEDERERPFLSSSVTASVMSAFG
jgi:hypothetical protein